MSNVEKFFEGVAKIKSKIHGIDFISDGESVFRVNDSKPDKKKVKKEE